MKYKDLEMSVAVALSFPKVRIGLLNHLMNTFGLRIDISSTDKGRGFYISSRDLPEISYHYRLGDTPASKFHPKSDAFEIAQRIICVHSVNLAHNQKVFDKNNCSADKKIFSSNMKTLLSLYNTGPNIYDLFLNVLILSGGSHYNIVYLYQYGSHWVFYKRVGDDVHRLTIVVGIEGFEVEEWSPDMVTCHVKSYGTIEGVIDYVWSL